MSKTLCKSIRKDGSPCQGHGLKQFDGYCIAHGPADEVRASRSRGGKNSSTAVRLDKRMPARLKQAIDLVHDCMNRVVEGTLSPAACNAACRCAKDLGRPPPPRRRGNGSHPLRRNPGRRRRTRRRTRQTRCPRSCRRHHRPTGPAPPLSRSSPRAFAEFTKPSNPDEPPASGPQRQRETPLRLPRPRLHTTVTN